MVALDEDSLKLSLAFVNAIEPGGVSIGKSFRLIPEDRHLKPMLQVAMLDI